MPLRIGPRVACYGSVGAPEVIPKLMSPTAETRFGIDEPVQLVCREEKLEQLFHS